VTHRRGLVLWEQAFGSRRLGTKHPHAQTFIPRPRSQHKKHKRFAPARAASSSAAKGKGFIPDLSAFTGALTSLLQGKGRRLAQAGKGFDQVCAARARARFARGRRGGGLRQVLLNVLPNSAPLPNPPSNPLSTNLPVLVHLNRSTSRPHSASPTSPSRPRPSAPRRCRSPPSTRPT
jgi:hypothetical protein